MKLSSFVPQSNLATFDNQDAHHIEHLIDQPSLVRDKALEVYNIKKPSLNVNYKYKIKGNDHSILNVMPESDNTPKIVLSKEMIVNVGNSKRDKTIDSLSNSLING